MREAGRGDRPGHAPHDAGRLVLHDDGAAGGHDRLAARATVRTHPREHDSEQVAALQQQLSDWPQLGRYREENAKLAPPAPGERRVVFYGDSITDAWGRAAGTTFFPGKPYVNRGISGQTTAQMLVRFRQDVIDLRPAAVVILAEHEDHVILVEQYRVPVGKPVIELPAGLVGDEDPQAGIEDTAIKELEEETGYVAERVERLGEFYSSPGMASEGFTLVRAHGVRPGGKKIEDEIKVHLVPKDGVASFIAERRDAGAAIDVRLLLLLGGAFLD